MCTATPSPRNPRQRDPQYGFWLVEVPSLRDFPQQFRRFDIVRNSDNNISVFALDVDPAVNPRSLPNDSFSPRLDLAQVRRRGPRDLQSPSVPGPNVDPNSGVYNAELVKQLSPEMQAKLAKISQE